jgi:hypothetical protein
MNKLFFFSLFLVTARILSGQGHQPVFPGLDGESLLEALRGSYKPATVLDFADARDTLFGVIDRTGDSLECIYTAYSIYLDPNQDPTQSAFALGINTEHAWPRGYGADAGNARADMHHLYPSREDVNADRADFPFGEIPDAQTTRWYWLDQQMSSIPSGNIDAYSEWRSGMKFEPRESKKGDIARSMFYFYTIYRAEADEFGPGYFNLQRADLCTWHLADPVDETEWNRNALIAGYQDGKPNPFILDCTLAARAYCPELAQENCLTTGVQGIEPAGLSLIISPNPTQGGVKILFEMEQPGWITLDWFDALGPKAAGESLWLPAGLHERHQQLPGGGWWICRLGEGGTGAQTTRRVLVR